MNINIYLPDDLGQQAKDAELPLSRLLRDAVTTELERRSAMGTTLETISTYEIDLEGADGQYVGRITGAEIATDRSVRVFLTDDERVILYDEAKLTYFEVQDPVEELRAWLDSAEYASAMYALGEQPVIDI